MRINQNIAALNSYRNLSTNSTGVAKSLEKLSSGTRINRAADDASGLVVSQALRAQIGGLNQATRNAQDGISVVQTAEGALNEVHTMLGRMRDLAVQSANTGANDSDARIAANKEVTELKTEIDRLATTTKFGKTNLLDGTYGVTGAQKTSVNATGTHTANGDTFDIEINGGGAVTVAITDGTYTGAQLAAHVEAQVKGALTADGQTAAAANFSATSQTVGAGFAVTMNQSGLAAAGTFAITASASLGTALITNGGVTAASGAGGDFQVGALSGEKINVGITSVSTATLAVDSVSLLTSAGADAAITAIDTAIGTVSATRADLGAKQNRFESVISNLQVATENLSSSESRIRDTDYAQEMVKFTRGQILNQAATSMLGQANKLPQSVLGLLQG